MISNVLLINQKGEVVISRIYREGASQKTIDTPTHSSQCEECVGVFGFAVRWPGREQSGSQLWPSRGVTD